MFTQLAQALAAMLEPLRGALADPIRLDQLLSSAGWVPDEALDAAAVEALDRALGVGDDLTTLLDLVDGGLSLGEAVDAIAAGSNVLRRFTELASADPGTWADLLADAVDALPAPFDDTEALLLAVDDVAAALVAQWLTIALPVFRSVLRFAGVISGTAPERIDWRALLQMFSDPAGLLSGTYSWGEPLALETLDAAIRAMGDLSTLPLRVTGIDPVIAAKYWGEGVTPPRDLRQYELTIVEVGAGETTGLTADVAVVLVPVPDEPDADPAPTGLLLAPVARAGQSVPITFSETWSAIVTAGADLTGVTGLTVRPAVDGGLVVARESGAPALDLAVALSAPTASWTLGDPDATRIDVNGLEVAVGIRELHDVPEPFVTLTPVNGLLLTIAPPDLGGFLRFLIGDGIEIDVAIDLDISTSGLRCSGGLGIAVTVPLNKSIGPLLLERLDLALGAGTESAELIAVVAVSLEIGPLLIVVEGFGVALTVRSDPTGGGSLGELDVGFELVPPTRLVVVVESDAVSGGGFVDIDPDTGRYAGGLALDMFGVGISAIVIVDTMIPGDPDAWTLFASLGATFPSPIPIGFGFTLLGVGGILALDRTMDAEALAAGLRSGVIDSLLFPEDLCDSTQLLAQIDDYFPLMEGNTVVGPVVMLGWGSPTIITAQLGVVVSLPDGVIAVMGSVSALLPVPDAPLLTLNMDSLGVVDVSAGTFSLSASLYDSRLLATIDLGGDMAMYLRTSDQPYFLLSVGGYHPSFHPPSTIPPSMHDLRRMSASIAIADVVSVTIQAYFAVTSNSLQFGASVNLEASVEIWPTTYTARGWFEFDVLLIFSPFKIVADLSAGVGIYAGHKELMGVDLAAHLEGPKPWYASGRAAFKFFGLKVEFEIEVGGKAVGEPKPIAHPRVDVLAMLGLPVSWQEAGPVDGMGAGITYLTPSEDSGDTVWVRPDHQLTVRQSIAPLDRTLEIVGQAVPAAGEEFLHITAAGIGRQPGDYDTATDWFAPAQFEELDRAEKLARVSFEEMNAGVTFGHPGAGITVRPDDLTTCVDTGYEEEEWTVEEDSLADSKHSGAAGIALAHHISAATPAFVIVSTEYTLVRAIDGREATLELTDTAVARGGVSQFEALHARSLQISGDPGARTRLVVVPVTAVMAPILILEPDFEPVPGPLL